MSAISYHAPASLGDRRNLMSTLSVMMTLVGIIFTLLLSNLAVTSLGIQYDVEGGSPLEKIHPATYACLLAFAAFLVAPGNPFIAIDDILKSHRGLVLFTVAWIYLLIHILIVLKGPFTNIVDTFLLPLMLLILIFRLNEKTKSRLALFIHIAFAANTLLGMVELASGWRLTPLIVNGAALTADFRPTALFGHPLANAAGIGSYIVICLIAGARDLPKAWRVPALLLQCLGLAVFGGRVASVLVLPFALVTIILQVGSTIARRQIKPLVDAAITFGVPMLLMCAALVISTGAFDQFADRFINDEGSANSRFEMFVMLQQLPLNDLIFGPDSELIATLKHQYGLEYGIESFWVAFVANYGLLSTSFFLIGLLFFCISIVHASHQEVIGR